MSNYLNSYLEDIYNESFLLNVKNFMKKGAILIEDLTKSHMNVFRIEQINE